MIAVSQLRNSKNDREEELVMEGFSMEESDFPDFCVGNLLDSIDFDDLFVGISDGDVLPDLEMDPHEMLADFSSPSLSGGGEESDVINPPSSLSSVENFDHEEIKSASSSDTAATNTAAIVINKKDDEPNVADRGRKSMAHSKNPMGKKKVKVDWTPELHRRFVQAVEQLGVDKAVPSRILELMGIDCLTRHNIASHLQKYRSHRKHLLAREAEAASWSQRRQMYGGGRVATAAAAVKRDNQHVKPWIAPTTTIGFPPPVTPPIPHHFRPLHVWGHPSLDQSMMNTWPKHLTPPPPQPTWPPPPPPHSLPPPPTDNSFWISPHHHHHHHIPTPGTPCFPQHMPPTRFPTPLVPAGVPPQAMYKVEQPQPPSDIHPSKESVDAAIGDVLTKPWLPLPLGLKPPSVNSVMVELQLQGISKIPPTTCA
ncbi:hypothetical protein ACP275_13G036800 [Erythranthe tilingii]